MNVVQTDVAGEPLQYFRQFVIRTALQCRPHRVPILLPRPVIFLKLMLDIEQPDADSASNTHHRDLDQQIGAPSDGPNGYSENAQEGQIGKRHAIALTVTMPFLWEA